MTIPSPYARLEKRATALAAVIPAMKDLAGKFWDVAKPVWDAVTVVHFADFQTADVCFPPFVELGQVFTDESLVKRVNRTLEEKHASLGWSSAPHLEPTDRQRACWAISEMLQAGLAVDRSRFDEAFSAITSDPDALPHLRPLFREAGEMWTSWVYSRHIEAYIERAAGILESIGLTVAHDALHQLRPYLTVHAYQALATWVEWVEMPGAVRPMGSSEYTLAYGFPMWPVVASPVEMKDRMASELESDRPPDQTDTPVQPADSVVRLTDRQKHLLRELLDMGAIGSGKKTTRDLVAKRLNKNKIGGDYGRDFAALSQAKFADSQRGPDGGIWLTSKGKEEAIRLRDDRSQS